MWGASGDEIDSERRSLLSWQVGVGAKKGLSLGLALTTFSSLAEKEGMLGTEEVLSMALLAGVWWRGVGTPVETPPFGLLIGVDLTTSEGLLQAEIERRPPTMEALVGGGGSGARPTSKDLRVLAPAPAMGLARRVVLAGTQQLGPPILEFRDELSFAFPVGDTDRLELKLDTEEEEEDVFLFLSATLLV